MFNGSIVAIVTPFSASEGGDLVVDEKKLEKLVEFQIKNGTSGIVPCGTTGESPTLTTLEHEKVIEVVVKAAKKRVPVIAGAGSNRAGPEFSRKDYLPNCFAESNLFPFFVIIC